MLSWLSGRRGLTIEVSALTSRASDIDGPVSHINVERTNCKQCDQLDNMYACSKTSLNSWGTGMIASSSTFRPHSGRVIRDLFRLLDAVTALYGSTSLQQSSKGSCSLLVSGYNLRADCQWLTLVPPLNSGANAAPASVLALM